MRNPNGYGSVVKLTGKRRKPYWVRKTLGFNEKGHPIYETVGYTATKKEGMVMLAEYNKDPYTFNRKITLTELWELWKKLKAPFFSKSTVNGYASVYNHSKEYWNFDYRNMRLIHFQELVAIKKSYSARATVKQFFNAIDNLALENDLINKGYARFIVLGQNDSKPREPFTSEMIKAVWNAQETATGEEKHFYEDILILLYTGLRRNEFLSLSSNSYDKDNNCLICGLKTEAGKNRRIPVHSKIQPFIDERIQNNSWYAMSEVTFCNQFKEALAKLNINKVPHECRHTFETELDNRNANRKCIDMLMGHVSKDVGNRIYNHKTIEQLREAIELVAY